MNKTVEFLTKLGSDAQLKAAYEKNPAAVLEMFGLEEDISRCDSDNKAMLGTPNTTLLLSPNKAMLGTPNMNS